MSDRSYIVTRLRTRLQKSGTPRRAVGIVCPFPANLSGLPVSARLRC